MENGRFSYALREIKVEFANGALDQIGDTIKSSFGSSRVFIVTTPGRAALAEKVRGILGSRLCGSFEKAALHVPRQVVDDALRLMQRFQTDCVVAIGGGSAIGLGKALVATTKAPLVAVPTTYSGSEMTDIWAVSDGRRKQTRRDRHVAPRLVIYDPRLTYTMPPHVSGPSGLNAIAHSVEALYSQAASPLSHLLAADGIRRLATSLPRITKDAADGRARWEALCGAHLCGRALDMTSMGLHHRICHVLGGRLGLPHALTHAVLLPYATAYNALAAPEAMATIASSVGAQSAANGLWELNRTLGITQTLADLGLKPEDVDDIAGEVSKSTYPNPAPVTHSGVRDLLMRALTGEAMK